MGTGKSNPLASVNTHSTLVPLDFGAGPMWGARLVRADGPRLFVSLLCGKVFTWRT